MYRQAVRYSYPAPRLVQFDDEDGIILIGSILNPGFVERLNGENGLRLGVETGYSPNDREGRRAALVQFELLLGILRTHWDDSGELFIEFLGGLGEGSARDPEGNQYVRPAGVRGRSATEVDSLRAFAEQVSQGLQKSQNLSNAFILFGRADRNSADYYMIQEYAEREYGRFGANGVDGVWKKLWITKPEQDLLKDSANNLGPLAGGRHVHQKKKIGAPLSLDGQRKYMCTLLTRWVEVSSQ